MSLLNLKLHLQHQDVLLRPMQQEDLPALKSLAADETLWKYFTHDLSTPEGWDAWTGNAFSQMETGARLAFTVANTLKGQLMGATSFGNISLRDQRLEIGWTWLGRSFHGTGVNRKMKLLMLSHCFEMLNMQRVEVKTDVLNFPARNALLKLGMVEEGILRSHTLMTAGRRRDTIYYSLLQQEWPAVKKLNEWA